MATTTPQGVFGTKPVEQLIEQADSGTGLRRAVGALDLTALGIGAVIGTGIFSISLPDAIVSPPGDGGTVNLTAAFLVAAVTLLLFFVAVGISAFNGHHFSDFAPHGFSGIADTAALIFFAYIGFDAISTAGGEARKPGRDLPIAILVALGIATLLYVLVALAAVGLAPVDQLAGSDAPLTTAIRAAGVGAWAGDLLSAGGLVATLFAFVLVNIGVIVLRRTKPDLERRFRTPLVPFVPIIGLALCIYLMTKLEAATWWRFAIWMLIGLVVYAAYGRRLSRLRDAGNPVL
jgi:amino acid transporter